MNNGETMTGGKLALALAAAAMVMTPAIGLAAAGKQRPPAIALSFDKISTFTPASADPRLAAMFASRNNSIADFKFTPAAAKGRPSQLRVAVRASGTTTPARPFGVAVASAPTRLAPAQYDLGLAVGWKRFAIAGDVARSSSPDPVIGTRETAVVGDLKARYRAGKVGDVEVKTKLAAAVNAVLEPLRERRREVMASPDRIREILHEGSRKARTIAQATMERVRDAVKLRY